MAKTYDQLNVYLLAYETALQIHKLTLTFPKIEQYALADQLRRSTKSICANLAEGFGRGKDSRAEFKRFTMIAVGSTNESRVWLKFAHDLGYINAKEFDALEETYLQLVKQLNKLANYLRK